LTSSFKRSAACSAGRRQLLGDLRQASPALGLRGEQAAGGALAGPALTVSTRPGDNLMLHAALTRAAPGDVIVVDRRRLAPRPCPQSPRGGLLVLAEMPRRPATRE
jgi:regulator of RNase E activity RraA